jgi:hypothetical protein
MAKRKGTTVRIRNEFHGTHVDAIVQWYLPLNVHHVRSIRQKLCPNFPAECECCGGYLREQGEQIGFKLVKLDQRITLEPERRIL